MRILSLDPGKTTGAVVFDSDGIASGVIVATHQIDYSDAFTFLDGIIGSALDAIVIERFVISQRTLKNVRVEETFDVIGGAKCLAKLRGIPVYRQAASDAKTAYPDVRIKDLGFAIVGRHAKDALRHALLFTHKTL